jgi:hypothetical protein
MALSHTALQTSSAFLPKISLLTLFFHNDLRIARPQLIIRR